MGSRAEAEAQMALRKIITEGKREQDKAACSFNKFEEGDKVETTKEYIRWCEGQPIEGTVVSKETLADQEELEEKFPILYSQTNPYVVDVLTASGETRKLNVIWLKKKTTATKGRVSRLLRWTGL